MNSVLLTGAGFTKTFGGYLASEMWAAIFNQPEVQESQTLLQGMRDEIDYEKFYDYIQSQGEERDKIALSFAVRRAFKEMEDNLTELQGTKASLAYSCCASFMSRIIQRQTPSFIFTLNQDLFFERFHKTDKITRIPGLFHSKWFAMEQGGRWWDSHYGMPMPTETEVEGCRNEMSRVGYAQVAYIKLHGSYGWVTNEDGSDVMVMGTSKDRLIRSEPLLKWYFSIFEEVVNGPNTNLLTIGYGFRDEHINAAIVKAMKNGLRLFVISPQSPEQFKNELIPMHGANVREKPFGTELWNGITQYWPGTVTDFYVPNQNAPHDLTNKGRALFGSLGLMPGVQAWR